MATAEAPATTANAPTTNTGRLARAVSRGPLHVLIIAVCLAWMIPTLGLFVSSFREGSDIATSGWWTALSSPSTLNLENYRQVLFTQGMARSFLNSLIIAVPATLLTILVAALAAYAFSWIEFRGREALFLLVVALLVVPLQLTLIPVLRMYATVGLTGTFTGMWIAHVAYGLPFAVFLLRNFFIALPKDLLESAFLEGASHFTAFWRIVVPLSVPALAALGIFQFLWVWNDLLIALVYLGGSATVAPMTVTISNLVNSFGGAWQLLTAAAFISVTLPLLIFFALQRYFVEGILAGAVKG
ncbi:MAG TPA: carbohydrate ABC transporter permease [Coriobacteriia bacterium]|nr:carbohydrate ABC transporter permease [Coriobacteriia bacterium]